MGMEYRGQAGNPFIAQPRRLSYHFEAKAFLRGDGRALTAAASPEGWPPPKPLSPFRRSLIANSISTRHEIPNKFMQISLRPSLLAFLFPQAQAPAHIVAPSL